MSNYQCRFLVNFYIMVLRVEAVSVSGVGKGYPLTFGATRNSACSTYYGGTPSMSVNSISQEVMSSLQENADQFVA